MKTAALLLACGIAVASVAEAKPPPTIPDRCPTGGGDDHYFPLVTFWSDDLGEQSNPVTPLSAYLAAMNEPPLGCDVDKDIASFRLLWVGDHPLSIRITRQGNARELKLVELDSPGLKPGKILRSFSKSITPAEWKSAIDALLKVRLVFPNHINIGATFWVLEGVSNRQYTMGWGGNDGLEVPGMIFLKLAGYSGPAEEEIKPSDPPDAPSSP